MTETTVHDCSLLELKSVNIGSGKMVEARSSLPFEVQRIYYLYDVRRESSRGAHAHKELEQLIVAACGSFDLVLDDARSQRKITLSRPDQAVHVVPGIWRDIDNFSAAAVCLVLASHPFNEEDYVRDYDLFVKARQAK